MLNLHSRTRGILVAGGFAVAAVAAPALVVLGSGSADPAPVLACPHGEQIDLYTDQCVPAIAPNTVGGFHPTLGVQPPASAPDPSLCPGYEHGECAPVGGGHLPGNIGDEGSFTIGDVESGRR